MSMDQILSALGYVQQFRDQVILVKLGGAALQDDSLMQSICRDLALVQSLGIQLVLVHGGGPLINQELTRRGITWEFKNGLRVTTPEMMDVIETVLVGQVNHRLVRNLNHAGMRAIGLSGADGSLLYCRQASPDLQQVGHIEKVDTSVIRALIAQQIKVNPNTQPNQGGPSANGFNHAGTQIPNSVIKAKQAFVPVIAPIGVGSSGEAYNINADWAASRIAEALQIKKVFFLTDQDGVLDSQMKLISELDAGALETLIENGTVKGGMLAKAETILHALRNGVKDVHILNARHPHGIIEELFTDCGIGTVCRLRSLEPKKDGKSKSSTSSSSSTSTSASTSTSTSISTPTSTLTPTSKTTSQIKPQEFIQELK